MHLLYQDINVLNDAIKNVLIPERTTIDEFTVVLQQ